ncbi:MAG TPA: alpha/beta fold hydrolase [Gaiellaceae bacterium]|nr:alpha/beta fold hydrolase [Gaiellaceae bacterium]
MTRPPSTLESFFAELDRSAAEREPASRAEHPYGELADQRGELRLPARGGPHPVAVVIHGGFWRAQFTLRNTRALAIALTEAGWATWNIEYRRVGAGGGYPQTLDDVAAACRAVASLDGELDLRRTVAVGHSAGGQLALWAAAEGLVGGAVALAGVSDLAAAAKLRLGDGAVQELLGGEPADAPDRYDAADPTRRLPLGAPTLLVHGAEDDRVPVEQSRAFAAAAGSAGDPCRLVVIEGADHFDVIDPRTTAGRRVAAELATFLS